MKEDVNDKQTLITNFIYFKDIFNFSMKSKREYARSFKWTTEALAIFMEMI